MSDTQQPSLDPRFWGPEPTRWQMFTARMWQSWLKLKRWMAVSDTAHPPEEKEANEEQPEPHHVACSCGWHTVTGSRHCGQMEMRHHVEMVHDGGRGAWR